MSSTHYDRDLHGVTPPRESEEDDCSIHSGHSNSTDRGGFSSHNNDPESITDIATLLKARLQYAQLKIATGMSTENLQHIEHAFISSPRQPRRPLPSEYPPTPAHSSPHSRKLKRLLLSAMTPTQNSWRKKKRIREQKKNEAIEDEAAARAILMLSSSSSSSIQSSLLLTPPRSEQNSGSGEDHRAKNYHHLLDDLEEDEDDDTPSLFDAVANNPKYEQQSKRIARELPPPPAIVYTQNKETGITQTHYQYNRALPPPPQYHQQPRTPPMFGRPLAEDPFQSKPVVPNHSMSRESTPPP